MDGWMDGAGGSPSPYPALYEHVHFQLQDCKEEEGDRGDRVQSGVDFQGHPRQSGERRARQLPDDQLGNIELLDESKALADTGAASISTAHRPEQSSAGGFRGAQSLSGEEEEEKRDVERERAFGDGHMSPKCSLPASLVTGDAELSVESSAKSEEWFARYLACFMRYWISRFRAMNRSKKATAMINAPTDRPI